MRVTIDGKPMDAAAGTTILQAAKALGIDIPTLCYLKDINAISACRVCLVETGGKLLPACSTPVRDGMEVVTDSEAVRTARRRNLELICSDHQMDCTDCARGVDCELRALCKTYEVDDRAFGKGHRAEQIEQSTPYLLRNNGKCILCRRCEATCANVQGIKAIAANRRGAQTNIGFGLPLAETACVGCGQCVAACPTGALMPRDDSKQAWKAIFDREAFVVAAVSPSLTGRIGELFGEAPGTDCAGRLAGLLRKIGFDAIFDLEECEKRGRDAVKTDAASADGARVSGACPAWRRYLETFHPDWADRLLMPDDWASGLKTLCRTAAGGRRIVVVHMSNCIAEKGDADRISLSTREVYEMIRRACVSTFTAGQVWAKQRPEPFDPLPEETPVPESDIRTLSVCGLAAAEEALGKAETYDLLEVYACPGGCLDGGGMPRRRTEQTNG